MELVLIRSDGVEFNTGKCILKGSIGFYGDKELISLSQTDEKIEIKFPLGIHLFIYPNFFRLNAENSIYFSNIKGKGVPFNIVFCDTISQSFITKLFSRMHLKFETFQNLKKAKYKIAPCDKIIFDLISFLSKVSYFETETRDSRMIHYVGNPRFLSIELREYVYVKFEVFVDNKFVHSGENNLDEEKITSLILQYEKRRTSSILEEMSKYSKFIKNILMKK